ncbi:MAG: hypothetical protein HFF17_05180 [Oscillospiraceae bacterium]|nr:hypothetical protein [Oscillospiraceae bacterium]
MKNRRILYGYQIQNGEIVRLDREADVVRQVFDHYLAGLSYQKISDRLNAEAIPFSAEAPHWNKHKVKRLLENPRYTGADGYPVIIKQETFQAVQRQIQSKTENYTHKEKMPPRPVPEPPVLGPYIPSGEVIRLTNAIHRGLERPESPEEVVSLILQGVAARYDCCQNRSEKAR